MKSRLVIVLCVTALLTRSPAAGAPPARGRVPAVVVAEGPKVDGALSDAAWKKAPELVFGPPARPKVDPDSGTSGRVLFDAENVYIGVTCRSADVKAEVTQRDGPIWKDDCVEVFVSPDLSEGYWHLAVNARGVVADEHCGPFAKDGARDLPVRAAAAIGDAGWTVELAIPLRALGARSGKDLPWRLNVTRTQQAHGPEKYRELSWAHLGTDQYHTPAMFGRVERLSLKPARGLPPQPPAEPAERGSARAVTVAKPPALDGAMADPTWAKGALLVLGEARAEGDDPLRRTTARVLLDAKTLYVGVRCREDQTGTIVAKRRGRDAPVWDDDCVEIYVAPDAWAEYYQFVVNPNGAVFDQRVRKRKRDADYNADVKVKVGIQEGKAWTVTLAVPLKDLNAFVCEDVPWRLNVTRYRQRRRGEPVGTREWSWSVIGPGGFHDPFHFGTLGGVTVPSTPDGVTRRVDPEVIHFTPKARKDNEVVLKATADIWLSDVGAEKLNSMGKAPHFKLKTCQEVAVIRFDPAPAAGREVTQATLYMRRDGGDQLRRFQTYTVAQTWREGETTEDYGKPSGACFRWADYDTRRPWAWEDSPFWDVSFGNGHTLGRWTESTKHRNGWIAVPLTPELIYAMVAGSTDGLALQEGGTLAYYNNFLHSVQSKGNEPRIIVELGGPLDGAPKAPKVAAGPAPRRAHLKTGAIRLRVAPGKNVFSYDLKINGKPVQRWRVPYPAAKGETVILLDEVPPSAKLEVAVTAVSPGGKRSPTSTVSVTSSPALALAPTLGEFAAPAGGKVPDPVAGKMRVCPLPPLVKIGPLDGKPLNPDVGGAGDWRAANGVWDGKTIRLCGARGEFVSYQLCVERLGGALEDVKVAPAPLAGPGGATIGGKDIELYRNWLVKATPRRSKKARWEPSYALPMKHAEPFDVPDPQRKLPAQRNQTVTVDVYVPKDARPGRYAGKVTVSAAGVAGAAELPVELTVWDFALPDELSFWPELNAYSIPGRGRDGGTTFDYHRLAHEHRCVLNTWTYRPKFSGRGKDTAVDWDSYDPLVGPLLSGEAFKDCRRAGVPTPCLYLPYNDSWPGRLSRKTYLYDGPWPGRDGNNQDLITHFLTAPYIGDGLTQEYKDAFLGVQKQFVEHFKEKGWDRTEMQCFYGGKMWFRIKWGSNCWWTTDEPYHLDDWLALEWFNRLWSDGRRALGASPKRWAARGDISRPLNQGRMMKGALDCIYYGAGGFDTNAERRRCRIMAEESGFELRNYGSGGARGMSAMLVLWINGSHAMLPWQTLGPDKALDVGDAATHGAAILVPGKRFGLPVIGDLRLKMFREAEQVIEYLELFQKRYDLTREQVGALLQQRMRVEYSRATDAATDDADATTGNVVKAWELVQLRKALADLIVKK